MARRTATPERSTIFSDGVFAVVITILVLELKPPESPTAPELSAAFPQADAAGRDGRMQPTVKE